MVGTLRAVSVVVFPPLKFKLGAPAPVRLYAAVVWQRDSCKDRISCILLAPKPILLGDLPPCPLVSLPSGECSAPAWIQDDDDGTENSHDPASKLLEALVNAAGLLDCCTVDTNDLGLDACR